MLRAEPPPLRPELRLPPDRPALARLPPLARPPFAAAALRRVAVDLPRLAVFVPLEREADFAVLRPPLFAAVERDVVFLAVERVEADLPRDAVAVLRPVEADFARVPVDVERPEEAALRPPFAAVLRVAVLRPVEDAALRVPVEDADLRVPVDDADLRVPVEDADLRVPVEDAALRVPPLFRPPLAAAAVRPAAPRAPVLLRAVPEADLPRPEDALVLRVDLRVPVEARRVAVRRRGFSCCSPPSWFSWLAWFCSVSSLMSWCSCLGFRSRTRRRAIPPPIPAPPCVTSRITVPPKR